MGKCQRLLIAVLNVVGRSLAQKLQVVKKLYKDYVERVVAFGESTLGAIAAVLSDGDSKGAREQRLPAHLKVESITAPISAQHRKALSRTMDDTMTISRDCCRSWCLLALCGDSNVHTVLRRLWGLAPQLPTHFETA